MTAMARGIEIPTKRWLLLCVAAALLAGPVSARADDAMVDVGTLPRLDGAVLEPAKSDDALRLSYNAPGPVAVTADATVRLLTRAGWQRYRRPDDKADNTYFAFKKGKQGLYAYFTMTGGKNDRSNVNYGADRINNDLPFPQDATDIVFDPNRPYLNCITNAGVDASMEMITAELTKTGWAPLSAQAAQARWPQANLIDQPIENGARGYFTMPGSDRQLPVMLTLRQRDGGRTAVEIKIAPFALPQDLGVRTEEAGLPIPDHAPGYGSNGSATSPRREVHADVAADIPAVLAFYRRELAARRFSEQPGASVADDHAQVNFASPEEIAILKLDRKYDLVTASLSAQLKPSALAARAKAKKDADDKFVREAEDMAKTIIAADQARRVAQAATLSDTPVHASADARAPVPLPDNAADVEFDAAEGKLEFNSTSTVKALGAFFRAALKPLGWREQPSVINNPNMAVLEFSKAGKDISFTAMQMGAKVNLTASGSGLQMAAAASAKPAEADLEADESSGLPVPKQHTLSAGGTITMPGGSPFRQELDASVPADLADVLAFYRRELGKRQWKEAATGAVVKADRAVLAFAAPEGPALLKLDRRNGETAVNLALKNPAEARKAGILPPPGLVKLLLGNMGDTEASITINAKTFKVAPGVGGPQTPNGPTLELPPGRYKAKLKIGGRPDRSIDLATAADDSWGLMVTPGGMMPIQMY